MSYKKNKGDVAYYLELNKYKTIVGLPSYLKGCPYMRGTKEYNEFIELKKKNWDGTYYDVTPKAKPIAYSTKATRDWLAYLKPLCNSWGELLSLVNGESQEYIRDYEAEKIVKIYIDKKADFNKINF